MILLMLTGIWTLFIKINKEDESDKADLKLVAKSLGGFITNKNLRIIFFVAVLANAGFAPISSSFNLILIQKGYKKEKQAMLSTILMPYSLIGPIVFSNFIIKKKKMELFLKLIIFGIIGTFYSLALLNYIHLFIDSNMFVGYILIIIHSLIFQTYSIFQYLIYGSLANEIIQPGSEGTFITALYSFINLGRRWPYSLSLFLTSYLHFNQIVYLGIIFESIFFLTFRNKILEIDSKEKKDYDLNMNSSNKKEKKKKKRLILVYLLKLNFFIIIIQCKFNFDSRRIYGKITINFF